MDAQLLSYYEAIESASVDMLAAARAGNWDEVVKLEGACVLLISRLKNAAQATERNSPEARAQAQALEVAKAKSRILQRIVVNEGELRNLTEPWLPEIERMIAGKPRILH